MDAAAIDQIRLIFSPQALIGLNVVIGLMMLGVSLELKPADFKRILISPKAPSIGPWPPSSYSFLHSLFCSPLSFAFHHPWPWE